MRSTTCDYPYQSGLFTLDNNHEQSRIVKNRQVKPTVKNRIINNSQPTVQQIVKKSRERNSTMNQEYIHISLVHCEDKTPLIKNIRVKFIDTNLNGEDLPIERNGIDINNIELMGSHDIAVCTMIDSLSKYNTRLKEWLTYNILLGVEHFYIFDNRISRSTSIDDVDHDLRSSILKPFIDANIVTLIYYPFIPTKEMHWNSIQRSTFQKMLQQFGHKNKWIGFFDIDEYFVPSVDIINQYYRRSPTMSSPSLLLYLLTKLEQEKSSEEEVSGMYFDTLEMGCSKSSPIMSNSMECNYAGLMFTQDLHGHGKIFVKPKIQKILATPHKVLFISY